MKKVSWKEKVLKSAVATMRLANPSVVPAPANLSFAPVPAMVRSIPESFADNDLSTNDPPEFKVFLPDLDFEEPIPNEPVVEVACDNDSNPGFTNWDTLSHISDITGLAATIWSIFEAIKRFGKRKQSGPLALTLWIDRGQTGWERVEVVAQSPEKLALTLQVLSTTRQRMVIELDNELSVRIALQVVLEPSPANQLLKKLLDEPAGSVQR